MRTEVSLSPAPAGSREGGEVWTHGVVVRKEGVGEGPPLARSWPGCFGGCAHGWAAGVKGCQLQPISQPSTSLAAPSS